MRGILARYFDELLHLRAVVECGSINRAAGEVHITQSALTRSISRLEKALGVVLLNRNSRGVAPTPYAEALLEHVRVIERELRSADNSLQTLVSSSNSLIRCGATRTPLIEIVPAAANALQRLHASIRIRIREGIPETLLPALRQGELDVVVTVKDNDVGQAGLIEEYLTSEPYGIYARAGHPVFGGPLPPLDRLAAGQQWVVPVSGEGAHRVINAWFAKLGVSFPQHALETQSLPATRWLILNSDRLVITTPGILADDIRAGAVRRLETDCHMPTLPIFLYLSPRQSEVRALRSFADNLRRAARDYENRSIAFVAAR